ncbi:MAG: hypothetical protein PHX80_04805 [Candidatus Nanoarchaeia archaeon]|nr:hypothetical protein [Candidatus Nanoarchaeia archaeon]
MKKLIYGILILIAFSCCPKCPECPSDDCSDVVNSYNALKIQYNTLQNTYSSLLQHCQELGIPYDTCEYPDTFKIITDTLPFTIYQNCFFCVKDSFRLNSLFIAYIGFDQDTFLIAADTVSRYLEFKRYKIVYKDTIIYSYSNDYFKPLVANEDYTDLNVYGFSEGVHHGLHDFEFAGTRVKINGTDSLIKFGKLIYYDLPERAYNKAYYTVRVMMPLSAIRTIELVYFNDQTNEHTDINGNTIHEDMNLYLTGLDVGGLDLFHPEFIPNNGNTGWINRDTIYALIHNNTTLITLPD